MSCGKVRLNVPRQMRSVSRSRNPTIMWGHNAPRYGTLPAERGHPGSRVSHLLPDVTRRQNLTLRGGRMGWHELRNGDLLRAAERNGFDVLITSDENIRHQNRPGGLRIAVLELGSYHWSTLQWHADTVSVALADLGHGEYRRLAFPQPPLVRRPA